MGELCISSFHLIAARTFAATRIDLGRGNMYKKLEILGTGCPQSEMLAHNTEEAAHAIGLEYDLTRISDYTEIQRHGVMLTPSLCVDGHVLVSGRVPDIDELKFLLN